MMDTSSGAGGLGRRIVVIGTTGSGKTTLARRLSQHLDIPHVELDALNWEPDWVQAPTEVFRQRTEEALRGEAWLVDGNYSAVRDIVWPRADTLVWLDFSFLVTLRQLLGRTLRRIASQEELWSGNRESFRAQFLSRDSLFIWLFQTYWRRRRQLPALLMGPEYAQLTKIRLRSPEEARLWLSRLDAARQHRTA